jgi:disulfide bond formation protein DsbB
MIRASGRAGSTVPLFGLVALAAFGGVAAALVSQHVYAMEPCPWCVLQRLIFVAMALAAILGLAWRTGSGPAVAGFVLALLTLAGIAAASWQHFRAAKSASCNLTLADKILNATTLPSVLPEVFEPRANCADAAVNLFGISYDFWSLGLFMALGLVAVSILRRTRRG